MFVFFFFQAEDGIRYLVRSRGLGDVYKRQQLRAEVSEVAHESFEAALVVKSMGREDQEARRFAEAAYTLRDANILVGRTRGTFDPAIESIPTIGTLAVIAVGAWRAGQGAVTAAEVVQIAYLFSVCLLYTSPSPRDRTRSRMPSSA